MSMLCLHCRQPLGEDYRKELLDNETYNLHHACFDEWAQEDIEHWDVDMNGDDYYTDSIDDVIDTVREMDKLDVVTVTRSSIKRIEWLNIPKV